MACVPKYKGVTYNSLAELKQVIAQEIVEQEAKDTAYLTEQRNKSLIDRQGFTSKNDKLEYLSNLVGEYTPINMEGESITDLCK